MRKATTSRNLTGSESYCGRLSNLQVPASSTRDAFFFLSQHERTRGASPSPQTQERAEATSQTRSRAIGPGRASNTWASVVSHPPPPTTVTHVHHQSPTHPHLFLGPPTCLSRRGRTAVVLWHTPSRLRGHPARLQPTTCRWTWVP